MEARQMLNVSADPYEFTFDVQTTALMIIDMQRDFLEAGGFGETFGYRAAVLRTTIAPTRQVLDAARASGMMVIHTREGHRPDLSDLSASKKTRGRRELCIGDAGPMGRILVRGERGHDIIEELQPMQGEIVIDKAGNGAFFATDLTAILTNCAIKQLLICGVTTEVCVSTTVRDANDRGYQCLILEDCVASYVPEFHKAEIKIIKAHGGLFGWVSDSTRLLTALTSSSAL
jgi:biuret amidohydrolase